MATSRNGAPGRSTRNVHISVNLDAVRANLSEARRLSDGGRQFAVIKADAYGHGAVAVARALSRHDRPAAQRAEGFAVVTMGEARELREAGIEQPILLLQGPGNQDEAAACVSLGLWPVIHDLAQLEWYRRSPTRLELRSWLKVDTGMGRLGVPLADVTTILGANDGIEWCGILSHLACADEAGSAHTQDQIRVFAALEIPAGIERSLANSAGIIGWPASRHEWARPGLMLYGLDPRAPADGDRSTQHRSFTSTRSPESSPASSSGLNLTPAMRVTTTLVSVKTMSAGAGVGYSQTWHCPERMLVGLARVGYADGFPRVVDESARVVISGVSCPVVGRVSMDSIAVDLRGVPGAVPNDTVELWGDRLSVDGLARAAGTIAYELLVGMRGTRRFSGE